MKFTHTITFLLIVLLPTLLLNAQVGIGTTSPNASLDIKSSNEITPTNTDGILIPKIEEFPTTNPTGLQDGMMVYTTGNGSVAKGFYYWDNSTTNWISFSGASGAVIQKLDDLTDGKSDNDGSDNGSSIFIGVDAGVNDDSSDNKNVGVGFESLKNNTIGTNNVANGYQSLYSNTTGLLNIAIGNQSLYRNTTGNYNSATGSSSLYLNTTGSRNTVFGSSALNRNTSGNNNVAVGYNAGFYSLGNNNVFIGKDAGFFETNSNRLYIESSNLSSPLIYGEFDNDLLRVNGDFEVEKATDTGITVLTPFGFQSSLKLFESGGSGDFGFEFQYDGSPDKLYLWSRTFAGNEGIRMTWLKNGWVGISTTTPDALLDVAATNPAAPKNTDGILVPRIDAFPATNPTVSQNGMLIFLTTDDTFYYWKNSTASWVSIISNGAQSINDLSDGISGVNTNETSLFLGFEAGLNDDRGNNQNMGIGYRSLYSNTTGKYNVATGFGSLVSNITGARNSGVGIYALGNNKGGNRNVAVGAYALNGNITGSMNVAIGDRASLTGNFTNSTTLGFDTVAATNTVHLGIASVYAIQGQVNFSSYSDARVKDNISEDVKGLAFISKLRPVTYHFNIDRQNKLMGVKNNTNYKEKYDLEKIKFSGFIAQEVEKAANESNYNFSGVKIPKDPNDLYALSYAEFVVPLVKAVQEQQAQIETLKKEIEEIKALLRNK